MRFASPVRLFGVLVAVFAFATPVESGCSDEEVCRDYSPPPTFDALNPTVTFARDVMPIFSQSCTFTSCHGSISGTNALLLGGTDASKVHKAIVNVRSTELQTMNFVTVGNPRESFLQRKIDGSHCVLKAQCTGNDCGQSMPRNDELLPLEARDTIRRWIAQGAKND